MREVFSAVVVIGIVLVAVFVPVAFFPGTTGRLYQQFSLTIAFAVVLSVFNAVTLTPALAALLLDKRDATRTAASSPRVNRVIDGGTNGYVARRCAARCGWRLVMLAAVRRRPRSGDLAACSARCPSSFVPARGRRLLHDHRAGAGRRVARVHDRRSPSRPRRSSTPTRTSPAAFSVMGFSFSGAAPNNGMIFTRLKPYDERQRRRRIRSSAVLGRAARAAVRHPRRASSWRSRRRRSRACRRSAASSSRCSIRPAATITGLARRARRGGRRSGNSRRRSSGASRSFRADDPQLSVDIDRDKAPAASACRCARSPTRCRCSSARSTSTTSTSTTAPIASTCRPISASAPSPADLEQLYARAQTGEHGPARHRRALHARRRRRR